MNFNEWTIVVTGSENYEVMTSDKILVVLEDENDACLILKQENNSIKVKSINYGNEISFNFESKEITLEIENDEIC